MKYFSPSREEGRHIVVFLGSKFWQKLLYSFGNIFIVAGGGRNYSEGGIGRYFMQENLFAKTMFRTFLSDRFDVKPTCE